MYNSSIGDDDIYNSRTSLSLLDRNTMNLPSGGHNKTKGNILVKGDPSMYGNGELLDDGRPTCCFGMFNNAPRNNAGLDIKPTKKLSANSLQMAFLEIFEENLPKYASTMDWVRDFIKLATKTLET